MRAGGDEGVAARPVLGERNAAYTDLPARWRAALALCPWCAGSPGVTAEGPCAHCDGTGDLLGVMLLDAYRRGREHTLAALREVEGVRRAAAERVLREEPSARSLRAAMGLGRV